MRPREAEKDLFRKLAKEKGYRSRAAFKLLEIQRRFRIIRRGDKVLDIGCYPGGWLQVASKIVGKDGLVVGVDIRETEYIAPNVRTVVADIRDEGLAAKLSSIALFGYDVLLSDISPNVSGIWELDHYRQVDLSRQALKLARILLKENGNAVFKVFHGEEMKKFLEELKRNFRYVFVYKPRASRPQSSESYVVCIGFTGKRRAQQ